MSSSKPRDLPAITDPSVVPSGAGPAEAALPERTTQRDAALCLPDEAPFDPKAWATGAEDFNDGVQWEMVKAWGDRTATASDLVGWRKSYCFGYLAAQHAAGVR